MKFGRHRAFWEGRRWIERVGPIRLGLFWLGALTLVGLLLVIHSTRQDGQLLSQQIAQWRHAVPSVSLSAAKPLNGHEQLANFYDRFPRRAELPDLIEKLLLVGADARVFLNQGDYRLHPIDKLDLLRYEVSLPVRGGYRAIREFVDRVSSDMPTVAIQGISFSRDGVGLGVVDAQVRFTFFVRGEGP